MNNTTFGVFFGPAWPLMILYRFYCCRHQFVILLCKTVIALRQQFPIMNTVEEIIGQTKKWVYDIVFGCNFCPFVGNEIRQNSIHYQVETAVDLASSLQALLNECKRLDNEKIGTTLLIFSHGFKKFDDYLELVALAEKLLKRENYEGVYQVASFHPLYTFAGSTANDPANYTNRSIYPMLHLLREDEVEKALASYPNPERIPEKNILFARSKGIAYMRTLLENCSR
jgi:hypothetical protein